MPYSRDSTSCFSNQIYTHMAHRLYISPYISNINLRKIHSIILQNKHARTIQKKEHQAYIATTKKVSYISATCAPIYRLYSSHSRFACASSHWLLRGVESIYGIRRALKRSRGSKSSEPPAERIKTARYHNARADLSARWYGSSDSIGRVYRL